jgi:hypothetical protein
LDKFERIGASERVPSGWGPRAIVTAGWSEEALVQLDDVCDMILGTAPTTPVVCLGTTDKSLTLESILNVASARDHELPSKELDVKVPFCLISGVGPPQLKDMMRGIKSISDQQGEVFKCVFAVPTPASAEKKISVLLSEITGDYFENLRNS